MNTPPLDSPLLSPTDWMKSKGWVPFDFQRACWEAVAAGKHGLLHAPTGSGKTYALFLSLLTNPPAQRGLKVLWITPLRALSADIAVAMNTACTEMNIGWTVGIRTGDTATSDKKKQRLQMPDVLVITPESLHVLFSYPNSQSLFTALRLVVVDEWHELLGSKRGVQTELALARLRALSPKACVWGISATIGNLTQASQVLHGIHALSAVHIFDERVQKPLTFHTLMPATIERYPWTGHIGIHMLHEAEAIIRRNTSTLVFTNTRSQAEIWYQNFLAEYPTYAGVMALHHGSLDKDVREWVEDQLRLGRLKVVFCTSSLDLGVDFPSVDAIIQIGSPKGVARFLQRAGRSGHQPNARSAAWFLPTHALEIIEGAALRVAIKESLLESREPHLSPTDVLAQWLVTLACGDGFNADELLQEIRTTHAYANITNETWQWTLDFITKGGTTLHAYPEFHKVVLSDGIYCVRSKTVAAMHRMQIGTIASEMMMSVAFVRGKQLGTIEEDFVNRFRTGDVFLFAGRALQLQYVKDNTAFVRESPGTKGAIARWMGGRIPLSTQMSTVLRRTLNEAAHGEYLTPELQRIRPLLELQQELSALPKQNELLIECYTSREGYHAFVYPFEGRLAHEGLSALLAYRISKQQPITFSMAMNDYGFELLSDQPWFPREWEGLFQLTNLSNDILNSANASALSRRRFREIARIAGLIFQGYPGKPKKARHLQASSNLLYDVFRDYDPGNLLLQQSSAETLTFQLDEERIQSALRRLKNSAIVVKHITSPTPLCSPILADRLRETLGSERMEERLRRLIAGKVS